MTPTQAADGLIVTGPHGTGTLSRQANGWDLVHEHGVSQSIDLASYEPIPDGDRPPIVELRTGDRMGLRVIGRQK